MRKITLDSSGTWLWKVVKSNVVIKHECESKKHIVPKDKIGRIM